MASGIPLEDLRLMLKAEIGSSMDVGTALDDELDMVLSNKQIQLATLFDWAALETDEDVNADARYLTLPNLNYNRPVEVYVKWALRWQPVCYGITIDNYNTTDSDRNVKRDPIQAWRYAPNVGADKFEVWPIPVGVQSLRFCGQKPILKMEETGDVCTLDGLMLVLFCAAEKLARYKQEDAQAKLVQANSIAAALRSNERKVEPVFSLIPPKMENARRNVPIILVAG